MPIFGHVYGHLSKQFIHIGRPYRHVQQGSTYQKDEDDLWACLAMLMALGLFTFETVELVFYQFVEKPLFWKRISENEYQFAPTSDAIAWRKKLVDKYRHFKFLDFS